MDSLLKNLTNIKKEQNEQNKILQRKAEKINRMSKDEIIYFIQEIKDANSNHIEVKKEIKRLNKELFKYSYNNSKNFQKKLKDKTSIEFSKAKMDIGKPANAFLSIEKLALKGDIESQYLIGKTYLNGVIGFYGEIKMKDTALGLKWLLQAYNKGHLESGYLIALYEKNNLSTDTAINILTDLSKKGHLKSAQLLLDIYKNDIEYINFDKSLKIQSIIKKIEKRP